jgi:hypothetical protein
MDCRFFFLFSAFFLFLEPVRATADGFAYRDKVLYRTGLMTVSSVGTKPITDSSFLLGALEYNRSIRSLADLRVGARIIKSERINRLQIVEALVGARFYFFSLAHDLSGPVAQYSVNWSFPFRPYLEGQMSIGRYTAEVVGKPAVLDFSSSYLGTGSGVGIAVGIAKYMDLDFGVNYQFGTSFGEVSLNPSLLHAYAGGIFLF